MSLPKPYWEDGAGVLYNGDCRDLLSKLNADLILTDPPYGIGFDGGGQYQEIKESDYAGFVKLMKGKPCAMMNYPEECFKYFSPILGVPDEILFWCYSSNIKRQSRMICIYNKKVDFSAVKQHCKNPDDNRVEPMVDSYDWFSDIQLVKNMSEEKTNHPCPVPIKLMKIVILLCSKEGDIILDPFAGSGTTLRAAKDLGRKYIGIEISEQYCSIAARRLGQEVINFETKI